MEQEQNQGWTIDFEKPVSSLQTEQPETTPSEPQPQPEAVEQEQQPATEPIQEPTQEPTQKEIDLELLNQHFGTSFTSLEQAKERLSKEPTFEIDDEEVKTIYQYKKDTGRSINDYLNTQTINVDAISDADIVKAKLQEDNPTLSAEEIEYLFEDSYSANLIKINEDEMTEQEIAEAKATNQKREAIRNAKLKQQALKDREFYKEIQQKYRLPDQEKGLTEEQYLEKLQTSISENEEGFNNSVQKYLNDKDFLESILFEDGNGNLLFEFDTSTPERREILKEKILSPQAFLAQFEDEEGNFDVSEFTTFQALAIFADEIIRAVSSSKKGEGVEEVIKEMKNTNLPNNPSSPTNAPETKSLAQAMWERNFNN